MSETNVAIRFVADRLISKWFPRGHSSAQDADIWDEIALEDAEIAIDAYSEWLKSNE